MFVIRNWYAVAAHNRNSGGPMKDRRTPRGGNHNDMREYLAEYEEDTWEDTWQSAKDSEASFNPPKD